MTLRTQEDWLAQVNSPKQLAYALGAEFSGLSELTGVSLYAYEDMSVRARTLVLKSGTILKSSSQSASIRRADGVNAPLIKNKHCGYLNKESRFTRASNVATALDQGHTLSVGDQVYIRNLTDTTFNGLQTVTSVVAGTSWTYANAGSDYSSGSATKFGYIIPVRRTIALASFTANTDFPANAATGYTYVADANTDVRVGFLIFVASVGVVEVVRVDDEGFTYFGSAPSDATVALSYDYDITIDGGTFDGNRTNQAATNGNADVSLIRLGCANNVTLRNVRMGSTALHCVHAYNCQDLKLIDCESFDCLVMLQAEGGGKRHRVVRPKGVGAEWGNTVTPTTGAQQQDDFLAWTGVIYDAASDYNAYLSPYGLCDFDDIKVRDGFCTSALNGIKITADDSITFDNFVVDGLTGGSLDPVPYATPNAGVRVIDDGTGLVGTTVKKLVLRNIDWRAKSGANNRQLACEGTGSIQDLTMENNGYIGTASATGGVVVNNSFTLHRGVIRGVRWTDPISAGSFFFEQISTSVVKDLTITDGDFTFTATTASRIFGSASGNTTNKLTLRNLNLHGNAASIGCAVRHIGQLDELTFDNVNCLEATNVITSLYECRKADSAVNIYVNNCNVKASVMFGDGAANIGTTTVNHHINNSRLTLSGGNNIFQYGSAGATVCNVFSSGTHYSNRARLFLQSTGAVTYTFKEGDVTMRQGTITTGQLLALNATPQTIVPAPGASLAEILVGLELFYDYNSAAYAGIAAGEDLAVRYTNGAGAIVAECETTGFLDLTADAVRYVYPIVAGATAPIGDVTPVANAALVLHLLSGEITTGNSPLLYRVFTRQINTSWP